MTDAARLDGDFVREILAEPRRAPAHLLVLWHLRGHLPGAPL